MPPPPTSYFERPFSAAALYYQPKGKGFKIMIRYRLENIDPDVWKDFKAFAALEGKTVRAKLLTYIQEQVTVFREEKLQQSTIDDVISKAGKRI